MLNDNRKISDLESKCRIVDRPNLGLIAEDPILQWQDLGCREFAKLQSVPSRATEKIPASFEFRTFWWRGTCVGAGQYWSTDYNWNREEEIAGIAINSIGNLLRESISLHTKSLEIILSSSKAILNLDTYNENSGKKDLIKWSEALENLGDAIENNIEFFTIDFLERIQFFVFDVIRISRKKQSNSQTRTNVKDYCRIRIRNAAGFISRLIDSVVEESDAEDREILMAIATANHPVFFED